MHNSAVNHALTTATWLKGNYIFPSFCTTFSVVNLVFSVWLCAYAATLLPRGTQMRLIAWGSNSWDGHCARSISTATQKIWWNNSITGRKYVRDLRDQTAKILSMLSHLLSVCSMFCFALVWLLNKGFYFPALNIFGWILCNHFFLKEGLEKHLIILYRSYRVTNCFRTLMLNAQFFYTIHFCN